MNPPSSLSNATRLRIVATITALAAPLAALLWWCADRRHPLVSSGMFWICFLLLLLAVGWWAYRHLAFAIGTLTSAVQRLGDEQEHPGLLALSGEFRPMADAFNRMSTQVSDRQEQVQETVDRISTVLGAMEEGVIAVDNRQRILFANRAAGSLLGFDADRSVGQQMLEVIRNHMLHEAVSESLADRDVGEKKLNRYELNVTREPANQILLLKTTRLPGDPCPGVVMVLENVTELRRLEYLRQEFVANVSHELKTPLTAIKAYAETLAGGAIDDHQINRKFLGQIETEADRLHDLIIDMLRLAQIESGHEHYEIDAIALAEEVDDCLQRHEAAAKRKRIDLQVEKSPRGIHVRADQEGLREILDNLIDNAIKYTESGGTVTTAWKDEGESISLSVSDTGVGIPHEALGRVFERFYRVDKARSRELGSTGLGLSIVKHIAQTFGGSVSAESEEGEGSTFTVELRKP